MIPDRTGQAYLSPMGFLYVVVSAPYVHPELDAAEPVHTVMVFGCEQEPFNMLRRESCVVELPSRVGWTRLA